MDVIKRHPTVLMPFIIVAFFETMALEFIYFATRKPISIIAKPIIRKFFGEAFIHYPGNIIILQNLFYYAQVIIYIFALLSLCAMAINIFKNTREGLPVKVKALVKNIAGRYFSYFIYGIIAVLLVYILRKANSYISIKILHLVGKYVSQGIRNILSLMLSFSLFILNIIMQVFLVLTIPIIVLYKKPLLKALVMSISTGFRNFIVILSLISIPFVIYFPISILKSISTFVIDKTFPEMNVYITILGIIMSVFLDCFIFICATQFLLDTTRSTKR